MTVPPNVLGALVVQYSTDNINWTTFGNASGLGAIVRNRRFALSPRLSVVARYWRVAKIADPLATDWGTAILRLDQIKFWIEDATLDPGDVNNVDLWAFNFDDSGQRYIMPVTDSDIEVYRASAWQSSVIGPYQASETWMSTHTQTSDTLLTFHQQVPPWRVMRQGAHTEWDSRVLAFDSLPTYDYSGAHATGVDEVQQLFFESYATGDTFNITLEDETTGSIAYSSSGTALAANVKAALEALPNVGANNTSVASTATNTIQVTFVGALQNSDIGEMAPVTLFSTAGGVSVATITQGKDGGEPIISSTRGWPATGCFYQQRLMMGGLEQLPETFLGSQIGAYFSLDTFDADTSGALSENIDTDQVTAIVSMFPGRNLQVFTNSSEFYFPVEPITPPAPVKQSTQRGAEAGVPQFFMDMATGFVGPGGNALYAYEYTVFQDNYETDNLSKYASHIVTGVLDLGFRKHRSTTEPDLAVMPRVDGAAAVMLALRDQEVCGFVPWTTEGQFLAAVAEMGGDVYVAVARTRGDDSAVRTLERFDSTRMLDSSVAGIAGDGGLAVAGGVTSVVNLGHLEGLTVALYIDGADAGDAVVTGAAVALPSAPKRSYEVGLLFQPTGTTLPFAFQEDPRGGAQMAPAVGDIEFRLGPSANLSAGINGGKMWRVPLKKRPTALLGQGPGENAFTGWTRLQFVPGLQQDAQVQFTQERPGPLEIQEIVATITS